VIPCQFFKFRQLVIGGRDLLPRAARRLSARPARWTALTSRETKSRSPSLPIDEVAIFNRGKHHEKPEFD